MANILLVDDDKDLLEALCTFLKMHKHNVKAALSQKQARKALSIFTPDVILIDVRINDGDGRELCKEIKEKHATNIPIILISASSNLLKNFETCYADDVIEKPFDLHTITDKINCLLGETFRITAAI